MKRTLIIVIAILVQKFAICDRGVKQPFTYQILDSKIIVRGKIVSSDSLTYRIKINEFLKGKEKNSLIIEKEISFQSQIIDSKCIYLMPDSSSEYVFFLIKKDSKYHSIQEFSLTNDTIKEYWDINDRGLLYDWNLEYGKGVAYVIFKNAIQEFLSCFEKTNFKNRKEDGEIEICRWCSKKEVKELKKRNSLSKWLIRRVRKVEFCENKKKLK